MSLLYAVLAFLVISSGIGYILYNKGYLPSYLSYDGPFMLVHSRLGFQYVEKAAKYKRFWRTLSWGGVLFTLGGMIVGFLGLFSSAASVLLYPDTTQTTNPQNYLAIPGVNDFLPLSVGVEILIGLVVGAVLHEAGHAVLCRVEDIELESTGLVFLSILPMGAFVEPDEESKNKASRLGRVRMAAAGILQNLFLTIISIVLVVLITSTLIMPAAGAAVENVYSDSPADQSELESGSLIVSVNGEDIESNSDFQSYLNSNTDKELTVTTKEGETATISRSVFITGIQNEFLSVGTTISSVNGETISTESQLYEQAREGGPIMSLTVDGESRSVPAGVQVQLNDGTLAYVTSIGDNRVVTAEEYRRMSDDSATDMTYYTVAGGEFTEHSGSSSQVERVHTGIAGIITTDTGITYYPVEQYLGALQFDGEVVGELGMLGVLLLWFILPLASLIPGFASNFPGFAPEVNQFFTVAGGYEGVVFFTATTFFWMAWMNFNLAFFNALPIWMLDGHHILRDLLRELDDRLDNQFTKVIRSVEYGLPLLALLSLLVIVAAPVIVEML